MSNAQKYILRKLETKGLKDIEIIDFIDSSDICANFMNGIVFV